MRELDVLRPQSLTSFLDFAAARSIVNGSASMSPSRSPAVSGRVASHSSTSHSATTTKYSPPTMLSRTFRAPMSARRYSRREASRALGAFCQYQSRLSPGVGFGGSHAKQGQLVCMSCGASRAKTYAVLSCPASALMRLADTVVGSSTRVGIIAPALYAAKMETSGKPELAVELEAVVRNLARHYRVGRPVRGVE